MLLAEILDKNIHDVVESITWEIADYRTTDGRILTIAERYLDNLVLLFVGIISF